MELIDANRISKKKYKELIDSLGGKYSFFQRIKMGGTGVGGLTLKTEEQDDLPLRYLKASETVRLSIEQLKEGLILGLNNTKEIKLVAFSKPVVNWKLLELTKSKRSNKEVAHLQLLIDHDRINFYTSGWNNEEVFAYLERLKNAFPESSKK